ncbi:MAG: NTP transferase domain-containing protein [Candidatus Saganbacteria bacterium]|nr:NTP transferase domain-containing protein [Candidatus Saganbacteria bacterium]
MVQAHAVGKETFNTVYIVKCGGRGERMSPSHAVLCLRKDLIPKPLMRILPDQTILDSAIKGIQGVGSDPIFITLYSEAGYPDHVEIAKKTRAYCVQHYPMVHTVVAPLQVGKQSGVRGFLLNNPQVKQVVITHGDVPFIKAETWRMLLDRHEAAAADVSVLFISVPNPTPGSTRILRSSPDSSLVASFIEEEAIADLSQPMDIPLGIMAISRELYLEISDLMDYPFEEEEHYGASLNAAIARGSKVQMIESPDYFETRGYNDRTLIRTMQESRQIQPLGWREDSVVKRGEGFTPPDSMTLMPFSYYETLERIYGVNIYPGTQIFASQKVFDFLGGLLEGISLAGGAAKFCRQHNLRDLRNLPGKLASFRGKTNFFMGINTVLRGTVWLGDRVVVYPGVYLDNCFLQNVWIGRSAALVDVWAQDSRVESSLDKPTIIQGGSSSASPALISFLEKIRLAT